jgi:predicted glycosyltransferase
LKRRATPGHFLFVGFFSAIARVRGAPGSSKCLVPGQTLVFPTVDRGERRESIRSQGVGGSAGTKRVWIDLDNSPHVPFFVPIIEELEKRGYPTFVTARDAYQVVELLDLHHVSCKRVGRHYGKHKIMKAGGGLYRAWQLIQAARKEDLALALSHGSRSQLIAGAILRIPSLVIFDYEFVTRWTTLLPTWTMMPEVIFSNAASHHNGRALKYPGLKENVYLARFIPDPSIRSRLGVANGDLMVTVRPPASEAHYHNPESDELFHAVMDFLAQKPEVRTVLLPRNGRQATLIRSTWPESIKSGKIIIPDHVVDGLNLLWFSDLAISGGGTMNREAAALGVPVYSIFRGTIGEVDRHLSEAGRLVLIQKVEDLSAKICLRRWDRPETPAIGQTSTLSVIVDNVASILESKHSAAAQSYSVRE